jgi:hypothetical protein
MAQRAADVETLRLVYADVKSSRDAEVSRIEVGLRGLTTLPATAGAILALFIALRPDSDSALLSTLYAVGLLPFAAIVVLSIASPLRAPWIRRVPPDELDPGDRLPLPEWLENEIIEGRKEIDRLWGLSQGGFEIRPRPPFTARVQRLPQLTTLVRLQILLAVEVIYLTSLAIVSPFIA